MYKNLIFFLRNRGFSRGSVPVHFSFNQVYIFNSWLSIQIKIQNNVTFNIYNFCFQVALNRPVKLSSTISAKVTKLPYIGKPDNKLARVRSHEVFTQIIPRDLGVKPDIIPLWIVVLAAVAGTAILLLLVYLLYKVSYSQNINRSKSSYLVDRQPTLI